MEVQKIVIDTDISLGQLGCDVDDAFAVILALNSPELRVELISTTYGNTTLENATKILDELLKVYRISNSKSKEKRFSRDLMDPTNLINRTNSILKTPPFLQGSPIPLHKFPSHFRNYFINWIQSYPQFRGKNILNTRPFEPELGDNTQKRFQSERLTLKIRNGTLFPAIKRMADLILEYPHLITLVPIGPLTNVTLLLTVFPEVIPLIKELSIMGGTIYNQNAYEFNFANDPIATNIILYSPLKKKISGLEVCEAQQFTPFHYCKLTQSPSMIANYLARKTYPWLLINQLRHGFKKNTGFFPYDPCAIINLIHPDCIKYLKIPVSHTFPELIWDKANLSLKTRLDTRTLYEQNTRQTNWVQWGMHINSDILMHTLLERISL